MFKKWAFLHRPFVLVWDNAQMELNPFVPSVLYVGHLLKPKLLFAQLFFFYVNKDAQDFLMFCTPNTLIFLKMSVWVKF